MAGVRVLREDNRQDLLRLCAQNPVENLFVASRVSRYGVERRTLGCDVLGWFEPDGALVSALHVGANLVPVALTGTALEGFAAHLGSRRACSSIMGEQSAVMGLYDRLGKARAWQRPREVRANQPLLLLAGPPLVEPDPRVEQISMRHFDSYFDASVRMYTEEVGVSPLGGDGSYAEHVRYTIREGRAYGIVEHGRVVFKSDIGSDLGQVCQVQGVWLDPRLRGRGLAPHAIAGVATAVASRHPQVSLYVNDFNAPALATYARTGFQQVGTFATVLY